MVTAFDFSKVPDNIPRWDFGESMLKALKGWLQALRWTNAGEVSNVELAMDFEVFTGIDLPGGEGPSTVVERGKSLWTVLSSFMRTCKRLGLPEPLPAERVCRVGCLVPLGAPHVYGGLSLRPIFAGGEETMKVLELSLARKDVLKETWGSDLFPDYSEISRSERAKSWSVSTVPKRPNAPQIVATKHAGFALGGRLCTAHRKPKCHSCAQMKRNYSLTIDACCQVHHTQDDDLLIECCTSHRMTRCGKCATAGKCCLKGHHDVEPSSVNNTSYSSEKERISRAREVTPEKTRKTRLRSKRDVLLKSPLNSPGSSDSDSAQPAPLPRRRPLQKKPARPSSNTLKGPERKSACDAPVEGAKDLGNLKASSLKQRKKPADPLGTRSRAPT